LLLITNNTLPISSGSSGSGKSYFIGNFIRFREQVFQRKFARIICKFKHFHQQMTFAF
jgi:hypothetical protein